MANDQSPYSQQSLPSLSEMQAMRDSLAIHINCEKAKLAVTHDGIKTMNMMTNHNDPEWVQKNLAYLQARSELLSLEIQRQEHQLQYYDNQIKSVTPNQS